MPCILVKNNHTVKSVLFSFVPKTGGSALISFFNQLGCKINLHNENNNIVGLLKCPSQHFHYEILDQIYDIDKFDYSFTIVRHPFDRLKSDYMWSYRNLEKNMNPDSFENWINFMFKNFKKNTYTFDNHIRPQNEFIGPKIKKVYKYEDGLEKITLDIFKNIGLKINISQENKRFIPKVNSSEQTKVRISKNNIKLSEKTMKKIQEFYKDDLAKWYS